MAAPLEDHCYQGGKQVILKMEIWKCAAPITRAYAFSAVVLGTTGMTTTLELGSPKYWSYFYTTLPLWSSG